MPYAHKLLVLDSAFSLEAIRQRGLEDSVTCRDLDGFFEHVWSVHPFASLVVPEGSDSRFGGMDWHALSPRHTFLNGKMGRFAFLRTFPALNFLLGQLGVIVSLARLIRAQKIGVIRAGDPLYLGLLGWILSRLCGIPLVIRVGGNHDKVFEATGRPIQPRLFFTRNIEKKVERFVLSRADLVAGANEDNLNFALASGARPERSTLFRYGNLIDRRHFVEPRERGGGGRLLADSDVEPYKFLLYIGRLEAVKHPDDVVRVLAEVRRHGHQVKALMVGDGSLRSALSKLAEELGVRDHMVLCGNMSQAWLSNAIPLAAAVVSPHTGRALSEAALGAAPIVAYDVDWQAELVVSGSTGELVPYQDWAAMAAAVRRLLSDPDRARKLGVSARERVLAMMSPEALNQHEREQYSLLLPQEPMTLGKAV